MTEIRKAPPFVPKWVTVFRCGDIFKADRIVKKLKDADIPARIPDKLGVLFHHVADLRNPEAHIRIMVRPEDEAAARQIIPPSGKP